MVNYSTHGRIGLSENPESSRWAGPCLGHSILLCNYQKKVLFYKIYIKIIKKINIYFKDALRSNFKFKLELINHVTYPKLL
jgi:hypothetical protein